ncbi:uncharacterized protein LOC128034818 [Gossypium raimondii]|uniref:uncharacterized protein LOC128034818 n=1 Tax=Gossypium raimondii TaxID=29730 RepID=UPI00227BB1C5|nr:uncharacterized protein LOC128034818 [Gossypium raimondii]
MALLSKNKLKFIDGTIQAPTATGPFFPAWERCNTMVISWLHHSIPLPLLRAFCGLILLMRFDVLLQFRPVPSCSCHHPCSCGALTILHRYHENDCVILFLTGLNDCFAGVRSQIMLIHPLPSLNKAFSMVMQQERQLTPVSSQVFTSNIVRQPSSARKPQNKSSVDSRQCTYCGGSSHTIDTCYKKHGYPPGYKSKRPTSRVNLAVDEKQLLALLPSSSQSSHITNQALPSMKMIGTAKVFNGLYVLELLILPTPSSSTKVFAVTSVSPVSLWHHRLGHLSDSRLKSLYSNLSSSPFGANLPCKTCHLAKQNKLVFLLVNLFLKLFFI